MSRSVGSVQQRGNSRAWEKTTSNGETPKYQLPPRPYIILITITTDIGQCTAVMQCFADVELGQIPDHTRQLLMNGKTCGGKGFPDCDDTL